MLHSLHLITSEHVVNDLVTLQITNVSENDKKEIRGHGIVTSEG